MFCTCVGTFAELLRSARSYSKGSCSRGTSKSLSSICDGVARTPSGTNSWPMRFSLGSHFPYLFNMFYYFPIHFQTSNLKQLQATQANNQKHHLSVERRSDKALLVLKDLSLHKEWRVLQRGKKPSATNLQQVENCRKFRNIHWMSICPVIGTGSSLVTPLYDLTLGVPWGYPSATAFCELDCVKAALL